jgi:hypothetical protein
MKSKQTTRRSQGQTLLGVGLVLLTTLGYGVHYLLFRDAHHIFIFLVGDVAFVFLEVLLVTLVIHRLLEEREVSVLLQKLNVVIGVFFSEIGTDLLRTLAGLDRNRTDEWRRLLVRESWTDQEFEAAEQFLTRHEYQPEVDASHLKPLRRLLKERRPFLLRMLENPNLLEHESFTEMLRMIFHLAEELDLRRDRVELPEEDYRHLAGDVRRAHGELVLHWLEYMRHLQQHYPYLFSLAMRTNPFDESASVVVTVSAD